MKRLIPTILLVVLCLAGFWYASSRDMFKGKVEDAPKQLLTASASDVQSMSLTTEKSDLEITRAGDNWEMSKPSPLPLNKFSVEGWVETFTGLTYENKVEDNPQNLAEFGLNQPKRTFRIKLKDGSSRVLLVGRPLPISGTSYAKLEDQPAVYEITDRQLDNLVKQPVDFMNNKAIDSDYMKIASVLTEWKGESWKLEKVQADKTAYESPWKIGTKEIKPEEGTAVLDKLMGLTTNREAKPASAVDMKSPQLRIEVTESDAGKSSTAVFLGKAEQDVVWIAKENGAWAYAVSADAVQQLFDSGK